MLTAWPYLSPVETGNVAKSYGTKAKTDVLWADPSMGQHSDKSLVNYLLITKKMDTLYNNKLAMREGCHACCFTNNVQLHGGEEQMQGSLRLPDPGTCSTYVMVLSVQLVWCNWVNTCTSSVAVRKACSVCAHASGASKVEAQLMLMLMLFPSYPP